ncbi:hypothetical protein ACFP3Q_13995 [Nocardioides sp. GCM10027113]|uniref:divisome protein SepX/GlpR n=1 Tax=unclassified Nocardioides TaxID=2615069 RepID=UPI003610484E
MDLSALIFVALAVAWAVYLIPKALKHHDEVVRSRSVDRFSHTMRVLARREPVTARNARLVVTPGRAPAPPVVVTKPSRAGQPAQPADARGEERPARPAYNREAANRAARRRRRVLGLLLLANAVVVTLAGFGLISGWYAAIPGGLLVAWLVACRLMVRRERGIRRRPAAVRIPGSFPETGDENCAPTGVGEVAVEDLADTGRIPAVTDPSLWDPMPMTLPTYVTKPAAARRTVRTIDLDSTGVWTSGRTDADSQLAREADEADRAARAQRQGEGQRAVGS